MNSSHCSVLCSTWFESWTPVWGGETMKKGQTDMYTEELASGGLCVLCGAVSTIQQPRGSVPLLLQHSNWERSWLAWVGGL